eukprot:2370379-Pyramimonas_sp.AAC.1
MDQILRVVVGIGASVGLACPMPMLQGFWPSTASVAFSSPCKVLHHLQLPRLGQAARRRHHEHGLRQPLAVLNLAQ